MKNIYLLISFILLIFGCAGADTDTPISLQIPFSGALTTNTDAAVENGLPIAADEWELFREDDGRSIGTSRFSPIRDLLQQEGRISYRSDVALTFDDGSSASGTDIQFFAFPSNATFPQDETAACLPAGESGAQVVATDVIGSGFITSGTGIYADAVDEGTLNYASLELQVIHADQTRTFCKKIRNSWQIQLPERLGFLVSSVDNVAEVITALHENGSHVAPQSDFLFFSGTPNPDGSIDVASVPSTSGVYFPLFCLGDIECGRVDYSDILVHINAQQSLITLDSTINVCKCGSAGNGCAIPCGTNSTDSSITVRHALYTAHSLEGIAIPAVEQATPYLWIMTNHDPVLPTDVSGEFVKANQLDYRCFSDVDLSDPIPFVFQHGSTYIISEKE